MGFHKKHRSHYKIRQLTCGCPTGDTFGITLPKEIAMKFYNIYFSVSISGANIILTSGTCAFEKKEELDRLVL